METGCRGNPRTRMDLTHWEGPISHLLRRGSWLSHCQAAWSESISCLGSRPLTCSAEIDFTGWHTILVLIQAEQVLTEQVLNPFGTAALSLCFPLSLCVIRVYLLHVCDVSCLYTGSCLPSPSQNWWITAGGVAQLVASVRPWVQVPVPKIN
jgi:hypothetical protein